MTLVDPTFPSALSLNGAVRPDTSTAYLPSAAICDVLVTPSASLTVTVPMIGDPAAAVPDSIFFGAASPPAPPPHAARVITVETTTALITYSIPVFIDPP